MKRALPLVLIIAGALLIAGVAALSIWAYLDRPAEPVSLPDQVAGWRMVSQQRGQEALEEITRMHRLEFPLVSGAIGYYGEGGQAIIWVTESPDTKGAREMLIAMRDKIAEGKSPYTPTAELEDGKRTVYALEGHGQEHFYFRSGRLLVWLAADPDFAAQALAEVLAFYP